MAGVTKNQERVAEQLLRDTRYTSEKVFDGLGRPHINGICIIAFGILQYGLPALSHFSIPFIFVFLMIRYSHIRNDVLPMRMPIEANRTDFNDKKPGAKSGYNKARGLFYIGNEKETGQELYLAKEDMLRHMLMLATTGAGKTETLISISANSLTMGGGLIYDDGKASPNLPWSIAALARAVGRDDDVLIINYLTGNQNVNGRDPDRLTNTTNPFALGSADSLTQILTSLIPPPEGDNAVFAERAISLLSALMYPLTELRDKGAMQLGASTIREYMNFNKVVELSKRGDLSEKAKAAVNEYLNSLPGYTPDAKEQPPEVSRQFGFAQMYFTRALSSLSDTYGHIYWTILGEVDFYDVVMNRRILVVLLPSMEKSGAELKNLGKIVLSAIRDAMSAGLGKAIEGNRKDVLENLPTASHIPFIAAFDEYGYMSTDGFSVTAAQARGLGFSCIFAGQDWPGIKRGGEEEAGQIWGNTNTKYFGKLMDPESMDMAVKQGGQAYVTMTSGYNMRRDGVSSAYDDTLSASVEKRDRIDMQDLQGQTEGEFHLLSNGELIRGNAFYANPTMLSDFEINRFVKIVPRSKNDLISKIIPGVDRPYKDDKEKEEGGAGGFGVKPSQNNSANSGIIDSAEIKNQETLSQPATDSLLDGYADIFDDIEEKQEKPAAETMELGESAIDSLGSDFMDEAARMEVGILSRNDVDITETLTDEVAIGDVIDEVIEYPSETIEAAAESSSKLEAADLLNDAILQMTKGS